MGMNIHVVGVRDLDKTFKDMMAVKLACEKANVDYPNEVDDYFSEYGDVSDPEDSLRREMEHTKITTKKINEEGFNCWEVDLKSLPSDIKAVRFIISY